MSRRKLTAVALRADHGPEIVLKRGERVVADIPDIDRPDVRDKTVRAARVRCIYDELYLAEELSWPQREAADRLAVQHEALAGAAGSGASGSPGWMRSTLPERMITASKHLREAATWIGMGDYRWLVAVAVFNAWPGGQEDVARLCRLLQVLAERWGME